MSVADDILPARTYDARLMRRLLVYLRPHVTAIALAGAAILVSSLVDLAQPWLTQQAIDKYIASGDAPGLARMAVFFFVLIVVGFLMTGVLSEREDVGSDGRVRKTGAIQFGDIEEGLPVVITMMLMPLTMSITNGIGAGFITYVIVKVCRGKAAEVHPAVYLVAAAFLVYFLRWSLFDATF